MRSDPVFAGTLTAIAHCVFNSVVRAGTGSQAAFEVTVGVPAGAS
ncbi:MAG: hypothetical protein Q8M65_00970 [Rhodoglobus sp.]|nr:hypothetical protein [Rhodoglobus sp.]